jgi:hydroxypyruvate isomerase
MEPQILGEPMLKWSANLTMLFKDVPFINRLQAAADAGFGVVEFMWPIGVDLDALVAATRASGMKVALFNVDSGDVPSGDRGFPNDPSKRDWWRERARVAIDLAERLGCSRINVQAGNEVSGLSRQAMFDCLSGNLQWVLEQTQATTFFLEPLNRFEHTRYILGRTSDAIEIIERLKHPRLKLMLDLYHTQRTEGNLVKLIQTYFKHIGHIQIADSPARNQPGTGEINWKYVLGQIDALNYDGYIGLEYIPAPDTLGSFGWLSKENRITCDVSVLFS